MPEFSSPIDLQLPQTPSAAIPDEFYEEFQKIYNAIRTLHTKFGDYAGLLTANPVNFLDINQLASESLQTQRLNAVIGTAGVALTAGQLVNLNYGASLAMSKADAAAGVAKQAHGWVPYDVANGAKGIIYLFSGYNGGFAGLTGASIYYLSATTPGGITTTAPSATGTLRQQIGFAISPTDLFMAIMQATVNP